MGNRKYSNKGKNAAYHAVPPKKDNSTLIAALVGIGLALIIVVSLLIAFGANNKGDKNANGATTATQAEVTTEMETVVDMEEIKDEIDSMKAEDFVETDKTTEYVKISFEGYGDVIIHLRADAAPRTVANFQKLVGQKFYDGLIMHRIINGFMIQGGNAALMGGESPDSIIGEFPANGIANNISHVPGVISMARSDIYNSASGQFFIVSGPNALHLDGYYAGFGYVVAGLDVVTAIQKVETNSTNRPLQDVVITKACFVDKK
jgi:peptidyl-prolyl cis-trans isomerase B (cyclophilin B)